MAQRKLVKIVSNTVQQSNLQQSKDVQDARLIHRESYEDVSKKREVVRGKGRGEGEYNGMMYRMNGLNF